MSGQEKEVEQIEIELLLTGMARRYGYDFRNYSSASLRRRVLRAVEVEEVASISALQERILREPSCMARFIETLSVHVTSMFRDPVFYRTMREQIIPRLKTYPYVRVWHAGCSTGEEVYSLAILLHEEGLYERTRLYATDISDSLLEKARAGVFPLKDMREYTQNYQRAGGTVDFSSYYTAGEKRAIFRRFLKTNMVFSNHNLVSDSPFNEFHLILCRNVMIYFNKVLRRRVHWLLDESLARFGYLALGSRETLEGSDLADHFLKVDAPYAVYRKEH